MGAPRLPEHAQDGVTQMTLLPSEAKLGWAWGCVAFSTSGSHLPPLFWPGAQALEGSSQS